MSRETWPAMLDELAELIGEELTLELAQAEGGLDQTYIPREPTEGHPWARVIGAEAFAKVVKVWGGEKVALPRGSFIRLRKVEILDLAEQGLSNREIARRANVTERHVRRVLGNLTRPDPRQTDLPF